MSELIFGCSDRNFRQLIGTWTSDLMTTLTVVCTADKVNVERSVHLQGVTACKPEQ